MAPLILVVGDDESTMLAVERSFADARAEIRASMPSELRAPSQSSPRREPLASKPNESRALCAAIVDIGVAILAQRVFHETSARVLVTRRFKFHQIDGSPRNYSSGAISVSQDLVYSARVSR